MADYNQTDDGGYLIELTFKKRMSGTLHKFRLHASTDRRDVYPKAMVQGGEHYRIGWSDVPDDVIEEVERMGYERVEE